METNSIGDSDSVDIAGHTSHVEDMIYDIASVAVLLLLTMMKITASDEMSDAAHNTYTIAYAK